jgi:putative ABC transport system substrate-binding protein
MEVPEFPEPAAAKGATTTIPIVIPVATDPVATGLVKSFARPGDNVTGFNLLHEETVAKRLELLKAVAPGITLVAVLLNPTHPAGAVELKEAKRVAQLLGLEVHVFEAQDATQLTRALAEIPRQRAHALLLVSDRLFVVYSPAGLVTSRRSAWRGDATKWMPSRSAGPPARGTGG